MPKQISCSLLLRQLQRLTSRIVEIVDRDFSTLDKQHLNWKPKEDRWSIAQCVEHTNLFLEYYLLPIEKVVAEQLQKNLNSTPTYKVSRYGKYAIKMVKITKQNKLKIKLDSRKFFQPTTPPVSKEKFEEQLQYFINLQSRLLDLIEKSKQLPLGKTRIPFNFWGFYKMKLGDLLQILVYHTERHLIQAQRVLYHDNFPSQS